MLGHYVFNASAIGLGGILTSPKRKVIPSLASVALAPTGGEGSSVVENYDEDGIAFDKAESTVWGSSRGNVFSTIAHTSIHNLSVFRELQVDSMWASVTSVREVVEDTGEVIDRKFTFQAEFLGVRVNGHEIEVPVETQIFDDNASYDDFISSLASPRMADYRKLIGMTDEQNATLTKGPKSSQPPTIRCTAVSKKANAGIHVPVKNLGIAHLGEALVKPGRRRLTLLRLEIAPRGIVPTAAPKKRGVVALSRGLNDGSMSVGSVEGNGTNSWP